MKKTTLFILACISLVGCKKEITCSSDATQSILKQKFLSSVHDYVIKGSDSSTAADDQNSYNWIESHINITINNIATITENKDTGAKSCNAQFNIKFNNVTPKSAYYYLSQESQLMLNLINQNVVADDKVSYSASGITRNVGYSTTMTDDNKTQLVSISDSGELPNIVSIASVFNSISLAKYTAQQVKSILNKISSESLIALSQDSLISDDQSQNSAQNNSNQSKSTSINGIIITTHDEAGGGYGIQDKNNNVFSICYFFDDNKDLMDQLSNIVDKQVVVTITGNITDKNSFDCNSVSVSQN